MTAVSALDELLTILTDYGLSDEDAKTLLYRFLYEEAEEYVECLKKVKDRLSKEKPFSA